MIMLTCKEQQAAAYKGSRKVEFCPDRQKCPRQICTALPRLSTILQHSYSGLSCFLMTRSRTLFDGSKGFVLFSKEYKKSEPFSYWKKVRILLMWCTSRDSNPGPTD